MKLPRRVKKLLARRRNVVLLVPLLLLGGTGVYAGLGGFTDPPPEVNLESGLIGHYKLNGNAADSSPFGRNGMIGGGVTTTVDRFGNANGAMNFNGTSGYIDTGNKYAQDKFTLAIWVYPTVSGGARAAMSNTRDVSSPYYGYQLVTSYTSNNPSVSIRKSDGTFGTEAGSGNVAINAWNFLVGTYDGVTLRFYKDGVQVASSTDYAGSLGVPNANMMIGRLGEPAALFFQGYLDDARIYNRAINADEVSTLYGEQQSQGKVQVADTQKGLLGHWKFDGNTKDAMPNANHGTINGGATLSGDRKGKSAAAVNIANSNQYVSVGTPAAYANLTTTGFSYSVWLMRSGASTYQWPVIMGANNPHVYYSIRSLNYGDNIVMEYGISPYDGASWGAVSAGNLPINEWHLFTFTYDGTNLISYKDGILTQTVAAVLNPTTGPINFGGTGGTSWQGSLDDARIYKRPLSLSEIQRLYDSYDANVVVSDLQKGLVGHWSMDGNAKDATPYASNGTVTGATLVADRRGRSSSAYIFNGSSQYISIPTISSIANTVTVSAWVHSADFNQNGFVVGKNPVNTQWEIFFEGSTLRWRGASVDNNTSCPIPSNNAWHHIVGAQTGANTYLYIDGVLCASSTSVDIGNGAGTIDIGRFDGGYYFNGKIDDVRIWNRLLNSAEVRRLYDSY